MPHEYETALSTHDEKSITVRDKDLSSDIMGEMDFGGAVYLLLTGEEPSEGEQQLTNAMLSSLMVHGTTPHAVASRLTYLSEPESIQGAVASGLLGVGSRFAGAMEECSRELQEITAGDDTQTEIEKLVADYREREDRFSGIGHPHLNPVDPRAEKLFQLADEADIAGVHVETLHELQAAFEKETGYDLPINVTGAIAAVSADMGLPPKGARGFAIISRAAGLVAEILEEDESPVAMNIWQFVDGEMKFKKS